MPMTEAQRRAHKKYDKAHYKSVACKCKIEEYNNMKAYAEQQNIQSMSNLLSRCVKYCIDNNIDLK